jgi:hydrogenase expression/formation protein HypC
MRVTQVTGDPDDFTTSQIATVDTGGISREIRLDVVDKWPQIGDYVIIHAGFAIHTLEEKEAMANIELIRKMAEAMPEELLR